MAAEEQYDPLLPMEGPAPEAPPWQPDLSKVNIFDNMTELQKKRYFEPSYISEDRDYEKDPIVLDPKEVENAKKALVMPPIKIKVLDPAAHDITLDEKTQYYKEVVIENMSGQNFIRDLKQKVFEQEGIPLEDQRLFCVPHKIPDHLKLGECYVNWMGYGLDSWPPKFLMVGRVKGFELRMAIPPMRDLCRYNKDHRMTFYGPQHMDFDVMPDMKVGFLKELIYKRIGIPPHRQLVIARNRDPAKKEHDEQDKVVLEDDEKTLADYQLDTHCHWLEFDKNKYDKDGNYIFDTGYYDENGWRPPPEDSTWLPHEWSTRYGRVQKDGLTAEDSWAKQARFEYERWEKTRKGKPLLTPQQIREARGRQALSQVRSD